MGAVLSSSPSSGGSHHFHYRTTLVRPEEGTRQVECKTCAYRVYDEFMLQPCKRCGKGIEYNSKSSENWILGSKWHTCPTSCFCLPLHWSCIKDKSYFAPGCLYSSFLCPEQGTCHECELCPSCASTEKCKGLLITSDGNINEDFHHHYPLPSHGLARKKTPAPVFMDNDFISASQIARKPSDISQEVTPQKMQSSQNSRSNSLTSTPPMAPATLSSSINMNDIFLASSSASSSASASASAHPARVASGIDFLAKSLESTKHNMSHALENFASAVHSKLPVVVVGLDSISSVVVIEKGNEEEHQGLMGEDDDIDSPSIRSSGSSGSIAAAQHRQADKIESKFEEVNIL